MKTIDENFADWEADAFGYGYGTGELPILDALKIFLDLIPGGNLPYDYTKLETALTPAVAWLLINALCHADMIEYGSSPRFGWLTASGLALQEFVSKRTAEQLVELTWPGDDYIHCYPDHCNCDDGDCRKSNPFWK